MKLSEEIMNDAHAGNCHSVTDSNGHCTCYIGRWHDKVAQFEDENERLRKIFEDVHGIILPPHPMTHVELLATDGLAELENDDETE